MNTQQPKSPDRTDWLLHRRLFIALMLLALGVAWVCVTRRGAHDPWYRNADVDVHNAVDALALNSGDMPGSSDQPALPSKWLLALDYRVRHFTGTLPDWNLKKFGRDAEPLVEMSALVHLGRTHSKLLVVFVILSAAAFTWSITRSAEASCLAVVLLGGSAGLLYHALLTHADLLCAWFGALLAPYCLWRSGTAATGKAGHGWLFLAGLAGGLAALTELPGLVYLLTGYAWCWLAALLDKKSGTPARPFFWSGLLPAGAGALLFWLLPRWESVLSPLAVFELRLLALGVGLLPLLALDSGPRHRGSFLLDRARELALLGGGFAASLVLGYAALRLLMPETHANHHFSGVLELVLNPGSRMKYYLAPTAHTGREIRLFVQESPLLLAGALALSTAVCWSATAPARLKALVVLLLVNGLALCGLLSKREFLDQFSIFVQLPLLWLIPLALTALGLWPSRARATAGVHWAVPVVLVASLAFVLTTSLRLTPKYPAALATDDTLPVSEITLTYLFDHYTHPERYRQLMQQRYGSRQDFASALERYLANPAHRE